MCICFGLTPWALVWYHVMPNFLTFSVFIRQNETVFKAEKCICVAFCDKHLFGGAWCNWTTIAVTCPAAHVSPARWWVWISSRPVRVLRDLRSLKATTGTMSSSLFRPSWEVLVTDGSLTASSIVPLCTGCVFSFGCASFGKGGKVLTGADFCLKKVLTQLVKDKLFAFFVKLVSYKWMLVVRHMSPGAMYFFSNPKCKSHRIWRICPSGPPHDLLKSLEKRKQLCETIQFL